jgi:hypothetical protein
LLLFANALTRNDRRPLTFLEVLKVALGGGLGVPKPANLARRCRNISDRSEQDKWIVF